MAGSTRYLRYILFSFVCLIIVFFISSSSELPRGTYDKAQELIKEQQSKWRGSNAAGDSKSEAVVRPPDSDPPVPVQGPPPTVLADDKKFGNLVPDAGAAKSGSSGSTDRVPGSIEATMSPNPEHASGKNSNILPPATSGEAKMNATFVTLARNSDVWEIARSIRQVEDRFNKRFHYDWVFLNDQAFDDTFIAVTSSLVSGKTRYGLIPKEHWSFPDWIDQNKAKEVREDMGRRKIIYGDSISYRHMCRYESGFFFRHPLMLEYEWYWRVEPSIELYCDIEYDTFKFMADNGKKYSFVISLYEYVETIPTLWDSVKKYINKHPEHIVQGNSMKWLSDDGGETYNRCHFWSNFEIGNLNWLRSKAYMDYFTHLDQEGGFFYERWGDAPVHSIAAALTLPKEQIHFFYDISYYHVPFTHCPIEEKVRLEKKCHCNPSQNFDWNGYSCTKKFYEVNDMKLPEGYAQT